VLCESVGNNAGSGAKVEHEVTRLDARDSQKTIDEGATAEDVLRDAERVLWRGLHENSL